MGDLVESPGSATQISYSTNYSLKWSPLFPVSHYGKGGNQEYRIQAPFHNEEAAIKELDNVDYDILKPISLDDARQGER